MRRLRKAQVTAVLSIDRQAFFWRESHTPKANQQGKSDRKQTPPSNNPARGHPDSTRKTTGTRFETKDFSTSLRKFQPVVQNTPREVGFWTIGNL